jgi:hypothetical protein
VTSSTHLRLCAAERLPLRLRVFWVAVAAGCDVVLYGALNRAPLIRVRSRRT